VTRYSEGVMMDGKGWLDVQWMVENMKVDDGRGSGW